ncbi:hypothetical protein EVAR_38307_1 [Eumeta japonica]|uniref:Uncharacterized protein n=1 Tax=Eumeta variegata TaxID=151549 RepID=A0A4C1WAM6_EUMVA|nr:hypothetical protein EVAR_38307_1 [Eumeta japonica]
MFERVIRTSNGTRRRNPRPDLLTDSGYENVKCIQRKKRNGRARTTRPRPRPHPRPPRRCRCFLCYMRLLFCLLSTRRRSDLIYSSVVIFGLRHPDNNCYYCIQRRVFRIDSDLEVSSQLDPLVLLPDVASLCMDYRALKSLFNLIPVTEFRQRFVCRKYHQYHLNCWRFTTVRLMRNFLPCMMELWNNLLSAVFTTNFDKRVFKKRVHSYLKRQKRVTDNVAGVYEKWLPSDFK